MNNIAITGKDLISWGFEGGKHFSKMLPVANAARSNGASDKVIRQLLQPMVPPPPIRPSAAPKPLSEFISATSQEEQENLAAAQNAIKESLRTPGAVKGLLMPDACPTGALQMPVGGVIASQHIHPGWHSADICCSMFASNFRNVHPEKVLNFANLVTHFGPGGRPFDKPPFFLGGDLIDRIRDNPYTKDYLDIAHNHLGTQGDGNHFLFVGQSDKTGETWMITHHGSRGFGAKVYKAGMQAAIKHTSKVAEGVEKVNSWLDMGESTGRQYWNALNIVRDWTFENHSCIHMKVAELLGTVRHDIMWNEHNFVFSKDNYFWHAKGATPLYKYTDDPCVDRTRIIPMNMAEPILIVDQGDNAAAEGFGPHGAGRNRSRTAHRHEVMSEFSHDPMNKERDFCDVERLAAETGGLDVRFYCGHPDVSELPSAYKNAETVRTQMVGLGLARIVDRIIPYGSIMAGDWQADAPWRNKDAKV